jgi:lipopolysaccharide transport protein LptA
MAPLHPERRWRDLLRALIATAALLWLLPLHAAAISNEEIQVSGEGLVWNLNAGTRSMNKAVLRQGNTLVTADRAEGSGLANGQRNSTWEFKGKVHIEFDGAVLDAESATVKFADNRLRTVVVGGKPANFSQTLRSTGRRVQGSAAKVEYDASTTDVRFSGATTFMDGTYQFKNPVGFSYNIKDGTGRSPEGSRSEGVYQAPEKTVPPPRTPDRATAP